jgi:uncharacterized protein YecE (DUF72 family)
VRVAIGTSGFSYAEWKGSFYPEDMRPDGMLAYYASRMNAVEINNTFYRMPKPELLESWAAQVPPEFRFVLKASQRITHHKRLKDAGEETAYFLKTASVLGERLGPILFQLPPHLKKDAPRLAAFLDLLPPETRGAFEFRHESWFDEETFDVLRGKGMALCIAEDEDLATPLEPTAAGWGYLRLRRQDYSDTDLAAWSQRLRGTPWSEAFIFFKHEEAGTGPRLAARMRELLSP